MKLLKKFDREVICSIHHATLAEKSAGFSANKSPIYRNRKVVALLFCLRSSITQCIKPPSRNDDVISSECFGTKRQTKGNNDSL